MATILQPLLRRTLQLAAAAALVAFFVSCGTKPPKKSRAVDDEPITFAPTPAPPVETRDTVLPLFTQPQESSSAQEDDYEDESEPTIVYFQYASYKIKPEGERELRQIALQLKRDKSLTVLVVGHTCDKSSEATNLRLSQRRANAVADYLKQNGVTARRITVEGRGSSEPLVENTSERNRVKNRRVEVTVE